MKERLVARIVALGLAGMLVLSGCGGKTTTTTDTPGTTTNTSANTKTNAPEVKSKYDTLVLGTDDLNGVFNPFFATTAMDNDIVDMVMMPLITNDRNAAPTDSIAKYVTPEEVAGADGKIEKTIYTFEIIDGMKFSDGTPITADDIIFTYKVLCDPMYTGASTLYTSPIVGINEYRYDDPNYSEKIAELKAEAENITDEEVKAYIKTVAAPNDYAQYGEQALIDYLGFANSENLTGDALKKAVIEAYAEKEIAEYLADYKGSAVNAKFKEAEKEYIKANLARGTVNVPEIEGVQKIDEKTVQVTILGVDPKAIWNLGGVRVAPKAYYGVGSAGGPNAGKEYVKGDLSVVEEKNALPMGSGAYTFKSFENNVVSFEANPNYFFGEPLTKKVKSQVVAKTNKLESVKAGDMDISDPTASPEMIKMVEEAGLHYELIDNLGYGYIGVNASRITDIDVRKGLMHLMNRGPAVETYYGELASVIERPMSKVSWAYPQDAKEVYAFSPEKALESFKAAGYAQVQEGGKTVLKKDGAQLRVEVGIPGQGTMDHPSAPILTQMKSEMEKLGAELIISDVDGNVFFDKLDANQWDVWVAAWSSTIDPDMFQVYHSTGPSNRYHVNNTELDDLIIKARQTNDIAERQKMYFRALDIIMEEAVEMPVYQRKNMYIFNPEIINVDTLPKEMTPFYGYLREVETLQLH